MVGDSKNDILAAKAAQMKSIGLTYGYNYGEDIGIYSPEWICNQFSEIVDIVKSQWLTEPCYSLPKEYHPINETLLNSTNSNTCILNNSTAHVFISKQLGTRY